MSDERVVNHGRGRVFALVAVVAYTTVNVLLRFVAADVDPFVGSLVRQLPLLVIATVALTSFGVAGVGGGATFAAILVLSSLNLPVALAGILISVEPLIDMGRTALNVSGSMLSGVMTSRSAGTLDERQYSAPVAAGAVAGD